MYKNIKYCDLNKFDDLNIIDIRDVEVYKNGHILNAVNIPFYKILSEYSKLLRKDRKYYIYCQKGNKSRIVCNYLDNQGYKVINIIDGYNV